MQDKKRTIIKDTFFYASSRYLAQGFNFITAVLMRRFLGPFKIGIWNLLKVVRDYADYTDLGVSTTVYYKYPYYRGKGELEEAERVKNTAFNFVMLCMSVISIAMVIFAIFFGKHFLKEVRIGLFVVAIMIIFQRIYTYYMTFLRAHKDFTVLSKSVIFDAIIDLTLILLIVWRFELYGLFVVSILMPILNVLYIRRHVKYSFRFSFNFDHLFSYIKFGFPIFLVSLLLMILNTIDRIMVAGMLGLQQLGFFSIAFMAKNYSDEISKNFSHIIVPHFFEDWGKNEDPKKNSKYITKVSIVIGYFMLLILAVVFITAPVFIIFVLPKFTPGITAMKFYLLATFFSSITPYGSQFLAALSKQHKLIPVMLLSLIINVIFNYLFIKAGFGISGVAAATVLSTFISFLIIMSYAMKHFESVFGIVKNLFSLLLPLIYILFVLFMLEHLVRFDNLIVGALLKVCILLVAYSPFIFYLNKKTKVVNIVFSLIKTRFNTDKAV